MYHLEPKFNRYWQLTTDRYCTPCVAKEVLLFPRRHVQRLHILDVIGLFYLCSRSVVIRNIT